MPYRTCLHCGSDKIIPSVAIQDYGYHPASEHEVRVQGSPKALLLKDEHGGMLRASICGSCGYTALFTTNASQLYAVYQAALARQE